MKVLFINTTKLECGVGEFGRRHISALRELGVEVTESEDDSFDLIHVNHHPFTLGTGFVIEERLLGFPLSVYFHDTPEWSQNALWNQAIVRFTSEPFPGAVEFPYPAVDEPYLMPRLERFAVGWTGLRGDGSAAIHELCSRKGWFFNSRGKHWVTTDDEVTRLSLSHLNILWYFARGRGKSLSLMTAAGAGRPLLINDSDMFSQAWQYEDEIYIARGVSLSQGVDWALGDALRRTPKRLAAELSWKRLLTERMLPEWERLLSP